MATDTQKLLNEALTLSETDRLRLAERLLATLDGDPDSGAAEAWEEEIARRSREIDAGTVEPIPWADVKASARNARGED